MVELQLTFDKESPYWVEDTDENIKFVYSRLGMFYDKVLESGWGSVSELANLLGLKRYANSLKDKNLGWSLKDYTYIWNALVEPWNDVIIVRLYVTLDALNQ